MKQNELKTIKIDPDVHSKLKAICMKGERFSTVINRLIDNATR